MPFTSTDCKFATVWLQLELVAAIIFLAFISIGLIIGKHFTKKSLNGSIVLVKENIILFNETIINYYLIIQITNGTTKLSQEISKQMSERYKCRCILLFPYNSKINILDAVKTYQCNLLDNADIRKVMKEIRKDFGCDTIDILIENGKTEELAQQLHCKEFIQLTSQNIMSTINVNIFSKLLLRLTNFIMDNHQSNYIYI